MQLDCVREELGHRRVSDGYEERGDRDGLHLLGLRVLDFDAFT
jgi:hypothetical protein